MFMVTFYVCVCMYMYAYACMYVCMYVLCMCACMIICICICICICMPGEAALNIGIYLWDQIGYDAVLGRCEFVCECLW
jgi:hypothetical protein